MPIVQRDYGTRTEVRRARRLYRCEMELVLPGRRRFGWSSEDWYCCQSAILPGQAYVALIAAPWHDSRINLQRFNPRTLQYDRVPPSWETRRFCESCARKEMPWIYREGSSEAKG